MPALELVNLRKEYDGRPVVDGVSLTVQHGTIFTLLGMNGAGKTTTLEILQGLRRATTGEARLLGVSAWAPPRDLYNRVGCLPQHFACHSTLTVAENLRYFCAIYRRADIPHELVDRLALTDYMDQSFATLSGGTQRRVGLATALLNDPDLVFLDEPTAGVDPASRRHIWSVIRGLRDAGKTVVLTTHYMDEAALLSDDVAVLHDGRLLDRGRPTDLIARHGGPNQLRIEALDPARAPSWLRDRVARVEGRESILELDEGEDGHALMARILEAGPCQDGMRLQPPRLEDAFLSLVGGGP